MGRSVSRGRKEEVELVEIGADEPFEDEDLPAGPDGPPVDVDDAVPRSRWWSVARVWPVAVVVLVAIGAAVASGQRSAARSAALQESHLYLSDLTTEPHALWSVPGTVPTYGQMFGPAALLPNDPLISPELLLVQLDVASTDGDADAARYGFGPDGDIVALDVATGEERWRVAWNAGEHLRCGASTGRDGTSMVVCERESSEVSGAGAGAGDDLEGGVEISVSQRTIELREPATGELLATRHGTASDVTPWGRELIVVERGEAGTWLRLESYDGQVRWRVPYVPAGTDSEHVQVSVAGPELAVNGPRQLLIDGEGDVLVDVAELGLDAPGSGVGTFLLPIGHGRVLVIVPEQSDEGTFAQQRSIVLDRDGAALLDAPGVALGAWADDGTVPDIFVVWGDEATEVWQSGGAEPLVQHASSFVQTFLLDGALVSSDGAELRSTGLPDGAERWSVSEGAGQIVGTDGETLLIQDSHESSTLRARSVRTGEELWHLSVGPGLVVPVAHGGMLFVYRDGTLVRYGT